MKLANVHRTYSRSNTFRFLSVLVRQNQHNKDENSIILEMEGDKMPGKNIDYSDLLKQKSGSRILLQGRPGCGKTRLMKKVSSDVHPSLHACSFLCLGLLHAVHSSVGLRAIGDSSDNRGPT